MICLSCGCCPPSKVSSICGAKERPWQGPLFLLLGPKIPRYVIIHPSMLRLRLRGLEDPFLVGQVSHGAFTPLKLAAEYTRVISPLSIPF